MEALDIWSRIRNTTFLGSLKPHPTLLPFPHPPSPFYLEEYTPFPILSTPSFWKNTPSVCAYFNAFSTNTFSLA